MNDERALAIATTTSAPTAEDAARARLFRIYATIGVSSVLQFVMHEPLDFGMLAWISLVPLLVLGVRETRRAALAAAYFTAFLTHVIGLAWIALVAPPGWLTTCFLEGFYGMAGIAWARLSVRRARLPLALALPPFWVALELVRGRLFPFIKFPWLFFGHTQHARTTLIQMLDLTSVYGLTFLVVMVNGFLADVALLVLDRREKNEALAPDDAKRLARLGLAPTGAIAFALVYGAIRPASVERALEPGPRVLCVQTDIEQKVKDSNVKAVDVANQNLRLTREALADARAKNAMPDVIIWSETMWPWPINTEYPDETAFSKNVVRPYDEWGANDKELGVSYGTRVVLPKSRELFQVARDAGVPLLVGSVDRGPLRDEVLDHPVRRVDPEALIEVCRRRRIIGADVAAGARSTEGGDDATSIIRFVFQKSGDASLKRAVRDVAEELRPYPEAHNSVYMITPDGRVAARYDKTNLVPASEFIPGKGSTLFGWFYALIKSFVPEEFSTFEPGKGPVLMTVTDSSGNAWPLAPNLCFEVTFPELLRESVEKGALVHVCPSNDGWFERSAEIPLAYDQSIYRAIETRRSVVRVVNRGITMIVDPLGRTDDAWGQDKATGAKARLHVEATLNRQVLTTRLTTFYAKFGDLFAWLCVLASIALLVARGASSWSSSSS